jgi:1,4-alpha-glucan branching enzyme
MRSAWLVAASFVLGAACGEPTRLVGTTDGPSSFATTTGDGGSSGNGGAAPDAGAGGADAGADASHPGLPHPDLGANVDGTGVAFAVWAPHATAARVEGDFGASTSMKGGADGVWRARVEGAHAGTRYEYVLTTPEGELARLDPYARALDGARSVVVDPGAYAWKSSSFAAPKREATVAYELHVGSFAVPPGAAHGTFLSARDELAKLADLGVDVVELMPANDFGGADASWGYAPELWLAPKPSYGTPDELRAFVDEAHARGIAVWLDVVFNHYDGWSGAPLRCFDGPCGGAAGLYFFGPGPYATTPWGPRPDYASTPVANHLLDALDAFMIEYRGDGFRWDSVSNIRALDGKGETPGGAALLVEGNARTHARGAIAIAEDLKGWDGITRTTADGGLGFDAQWDGFGYTVGSVIVPPSDDGRDMGALEGALTGSYAGDPFARLLYVETHDTVGNGGARLPVLVDAADPESFAARRRSMIARALLLTAPGVPMLFMGEEYATASPFDDPPAPLAPPTARGVEQLAFTRDLVRLRRNQGGGAGGLSEPGIEILHRNDANKVLAYRRFGASGEDVIVVVNLRNKAYARYDIGVAGAGAYTVRVNSERKAYGSDFADGQTGAIATLPLPKDGKPNTLPLALGAYAAMVLTR